jgi:hypothetical protein
MKKAPEPGEEVHPMLEGLQQLKFDPDENTTDELAEKYKEDGNYWMKMKKYRIAVMNYTEGLQQNSENKEIVANLYNNRSAAQFFLKNFRSSIADARKALEFKSDYSKAKLRILKSLLELKKFDESVKEAQEFLMDDPTNKDLTEFLKVALSRRTERERNERKIQMQEKKKRQEFQTLTQALINRKVKFEEVKSRDLAKDLTFEIIQPKIDPLHDFPISIQSDGTIYYPAIFCYPEFKLTDIQQQLIEHVTMQEILESMIEQSDEQSPPKYPNVDLVNIFYENRFKGKLIKVYKEKTIKEIVSEDDFWIYRGYLTFYVTPKDSSIESGFVNQVRKPVI